MLGDSDPLAPFPSSQPATSSPPPHFTLMATPCVFSSPETSSPGLKTVSYSPLPPASSPFHPLPWKYPYFVRDSRPWTPWLFPLLPPLPAFLSFPALLARVCITSLGPVRIRSSFCLLCFPGPPAWSAWGCPASQVPLPARVWAAESGRRKPHSSSTWCYRSSQPSVSLGL